mgnify:FL=1
MNGEMLSTKAIPTAVSSFENESSSLFIGCQDGTLLSVHLQDSVVTIEAALRFHHAPISSVARCPWRSLGQRSQDDRLISGLLLTASFDWPMALWLPTATSRPLCVLAAGTTYVVDVRWSPVNPLVFAAAVGGGVLQLWQLEKNRSVGAGER